ncbi:MAG: cation transporter [Clostridia bacterium]
MQESRWKIEGMHCLDCATKVELALRAVPGVEIAQVNYLKKRAVLTLTAPVAEKTVMEAVESAGYRAQPER